LLAASKKGREDVVKMLLELATAKRFKAFADIMNKVGMTPLMIAAKYGRVEVVKVLLSSGANHALVDKVSFFKETSPPETHHETIALATLLTS